MLKYFKIILFLVSFSATAQVANFDWVKIIGAKNSEEATDLSLDKWGNIYVIGSIGDTCDMDPGPGVFNLISSELGNVFVAKYDSLGKLRWAVRFGGSDFEAPSAIEVDTLGFVYICGTFGDVIDFDPGVPTFTLDAQSGPSFILKLDSASNFIWAKQFGQAAFEMAIDKSSNLYLSGYGINGGDFDPGPSYFSLPYCGVYAIKINSNGMLIWARSFGGGGTDYAQSIGVDQFGGVYVGGVFRNSSDFDPGPGVFNLSSINFGAFLVKLNSSGNFVWARAISTTTASTSTGNADTKDIAFGPNTEVYFGGDFSGTLDFDFGPAVYNLTSSANEGFITKLDITGNLSWAVTTGGEVNALKCDKEGDIYAIGVLSNNCDFDPGPMTYTINSTDEFYMSRLTSSADFVWAYAYGPSTVGYVNAIALDANENVYTTGAASYYPDWDIGPATYTVNPPNYMTLDIFLHKVSQDTGIFIRDVGISEMNVSNAFSIFPNPATNKFKIHSKKNVQLNEIVIISVLGEEVEHLMLTENVNEIDISKLKAGIYFLRLFTGSHLAGTCKLIKNEE